MWERHLAANAAVHRETYRGKMPLPHFYSAFKNLVLRVRSAIIGFTIENACKQIRSPNIDIRISDLYETKPSRLKPKPGPPDQDALLTLFGVDREAEFKVFVFHLTPRTHESLNPLFCCYVPKNHPAQ